MPEATRRSLALLVVAATLSFGGRARAGDGDDDSDDNRPAAVAPSPVTEAAPPARYFYHHYDYGSQALYSPVWVFLNRGYDVLQDHVASRNILYQHYRTNAGNVLRNLANPFPAISADGWKTFLTEEIFPLSFTQGTARWVPNYTLHLIGGGMTFTALAEWFEDRSVPLPHLWSGLTLMASALVNETIENKGIVGYNTDAIADIWVFDIAGMILFSFDAPNRFFSRQVVISDWSLQPTFTLPRGHLHNEGNNFAARWALPFYPRLRLFAWFGESTTGGLSFRITDEYSISGSAGGAVVHLVNPSTMRVNNTVVFTPTAAAFLDRNESLLASVQVTDIDDYFVSVNLYPHAVFTRGPAAGMWTVIDKRGRPAIGVSFSALLGVGAGWSSF